MQASKPRPRKRGRCVLCLRIVPAVRFGYCRGCWQGVTPITR